MRAKAYAAMADAAARGGAARVKKRRGVGGLLFEAAQAFAIIVI